MNYVPPAELDVYGVRCALDARSVAIVQAHADGMIPGPYAIVWNGTAMVLDGGRVDIRASREEDPYGVRWSVRRSIVVTSLNLNATWVGNGGSFEVARVELLVAQHLLVDGIESIHPKTRSTEADRWRKIAFHLADCHAATRELAKHRKTTSKSAFARLNSVCHGAYEALTAGQRKPHDRDRSEADILERLRLP